MKNQNTLEHKNRLDVEVANRNLLPSRSISKDMIERERIMVNGKIVTKPSFEVSEKDEIVFINDKKIFVSRAGEKLNHAIEAFKLNVSELSVLDIGSSTGGFIDCLLQKKVKEIVAVDVGKNQLHESLKNNPKIAVFENTDIRKIKSNKFYFEKFENKKFDLITVDVSFISLTLIIDQIFELTSENGKVILLIKPQFEVGKELAKKHKGVIKNDKERNLVLEKVIKSAEKIGFNFIDKTESPIEGEKGNKEFLILIEKNN